MLKKKIREQAEQIVLAGSFTRPINIAPSDVIAADCAALGSIGVRFV